MSNQGAVAFARISTPLVWLDEYGLLRDGSDWVALSIREWKLMTPLVEHFGAVVSYDALAAAAWQGEPGQGSLNVLIRRTRRRIAPLQLMLFNVRGRGYMLDYTFTHATNEADVAG